MPAMLLDRQQAASDEFPKMLARRCRSDPSDPGQLARRKSTPVEKCGEHRRSARVADQCRYRGEIAVGGADR
jgi:hypothetical protein